MRVACVFFLTFICCALFFWGCSAFISAVPNPMAWRSEGRFALVFATMVLGGGLSIGAAAIYHENC